MMTYRSLASLIFLVSLVCHDWSVSAFLCPAPRINQIQPLLSPQEKLSPSPPFIRVPCRNGIDQTAYNWSLPAVSDWAKVVLTESGTVPILPALLVNVVLFTSLSSKLQTMLTPAGFGNALILGTGLWATLGWKGWLYCVLYLFLGQAVTKVRFAEKESKGLAEGRGGRRGPENVWGSAATGLACAICASKEITIFGVGKDLFLLGYVASLATKLADTFASEIGKAYGKTTFLITNLERVEPGTEGAVSAEGTAAALLGGFLLSLCGYFLGLISLPSCIFVSSVSAFIATNIESLLGATLQEKEGLEWITNEVINFFNTAIGAVLAMVIGRLLLNL